MNKSKVVVHCLVKNEENYIWYALNSVLPFVDKILVWDTGSEDNTVEIIKSIKSPKIELKVVGSVDQDEFTKMRNEMLKATNIKAYDWLMILDGDEIWPSQAISKAVKHTQTHPNTQAVFVRTINSVGDIYHKQSQSAGHYQIKGETGHLGLRFINLKLVKGLHVNLPHGQQGFFSESNVLVQDLPNVDFVDTYYLHTTHLPRSSMDKNTLKRSFKKKYELGEIVNKKELPEILFQKHPAIVSDVTKPMDFFTFIKCTLQTIPRRIKRKIFPSNEGY